MLQQGHFKIIFFIIIINSMDDKYWWNSIYLFLRSIIFFALWPSSISDISILFNDEHTNDFCFSAKMFKNTNYIVTKQVFVIVFIFLNEWEWCESFYTEKFIKSDRTEWSWMIITHTYALNLNKINFICFFDVSINLFMLKYKNAMLKINKIIIVNLFVCVNSF